MWRVPPQKFSADLKDQKLLHFHSLSLTSLHFTPWQEGRGSTRRGKNHAHKTFDSTEASWYHQGSFSLILEKFEQIYDPLWGRRKTRSKITLKSFYSLKEFWHQASHLCIWKPMAWSSFLLTEFIYIGQLGQLLGRKKNSKDQSCLKTNSLINL